MARDRIKRYAQTGYKYGKAAVKFSFRKDVLFVTYAVKALIIFGPLLYAKYVADQKAKILPP